MARKQPDTDRLISTGELRGQLALYLGWPVSESTVRSWVGKGMPAVQPGGARGRRFFRWPDVVAWISAGSVPVADHQPELETAEL